CSPSLLPALETGHPANIERNFRSAFPESKSVRSKFFRWPVPEILVAVLFTCSPVRAQTRIAHTSQGFRSFQYAVINNAGEVCFSATKINGAGHAVAGVYKGSGGGIASVLENEIAAPAGQLVPLGN